jgi:hypothetical protein
MKPAANPKSKPTERSFGSSSSESFSGPDDFDLPNLK